MCQHLPDIHLTPLGLAHGAEIIDPVDQFVGVLQVKNAFHFLIF